MALKQIFNKPNSSGRIARWALILQDLQELNIIHRPGIKHSNVDALSRGVAATIESDQVDSNKANIRTVQDNDKVCHQMITLLEKATLTSENNEDKTTALLSSTYMLIDGLLYYQEKDAEPEPRLAVPLSLRVEILESCDEDIYAGRSLCIHKNFGQNSNEISLAIDCRRCSETLF